MARWLVAAAVIVYATAGVPTRASAQYSWGRANRPRVGACFYKDHDFRGDYFCASVGESERDMPHGMNDKISSIRVFGDASVTVFQDSRFEGRSSRFDYDVPNLKREGWNNLISSFRVSGGYGHNHGYGYGHGYEQSNRMEVDAVIRRAYQDVLNREPDDRGLRVYRNHMMHDGWTEQQVRRALRESPEHRQQGQMTYAKAQTIVRQAYLHVLHREPDAGASGYISKVMSSGWTQSDVERELRKSPEYRKR